jgi:MscS family membrane protein
VKDFFQHPLYGHYGQDTIAELCWCLGILAAGLLFRKLLTRGIVHVLFGFLKKYSGQSVGYDRLFLLLRRPLGNLVLLLSVYFAFDRLTFPNEWNLVGIERFGLRMFLDRSFLTILALYFTVILLKLVDFFGIVLSTRSRLSGSASKSDEQIIPFMTESLKVMVVILSIFAALGSVFRINVASLIAGLGIGGLAVALAAKESLENLLGSFTIFLDKPFLVGDHVKVGNIEGTVESIGFRSTRLRTVEKTYLTVPNKKMVDAELDNFSLRSQRRIRLVLNLVYTTSPEQLKKISLDIRELMSLFPKIMEAERQVRLLKLHETSLQVLVLCFLDSNDWNEYIQHVEELNYGILGIVRNNGSDFVYPDRTIVVQKS